MESIGPQCKAARAAAALLAMQEALVNVTCKSALDLQVLQLDECTSLRGKPAAAAILAIARHGRLGELALPYLHEQQSMVLNLLQNSKDLRRLSASQHMYASPIHKGLSCRGRFATPSQQASAYSKPLFILCRCAAVCQHNTHVFM